MDNPPFSSDDLRRLAFEGFLVGPNETEAEFSQRIHMLRQNKTIKPHFLNQKALEHLQEFSVSPQWISFEYHKQGLKSWEAAATWIDQDNIPEIRMRPLSKIFRWLGYSEEEILSHEAIHAMRSSFEEPHFEEYLAFRTSTKRYRRWLGPLFSSKKYLLGLSVICVGFLILKLFFDNLYLNLSLGFCISLWTWIESRNYCLFIKVLKKVSQDLSSNNLLPILLLKDDEFFRLRKSESIDIKYLAKKKALSSLRWKQIHSLF